MLPRWQSFVGSTLAFCWSVVGPTLTNDVGPISFHTPDRPNCQRLVRCWPNALSPTSPAYANVMPTLVWLDLRVLAVIIINHYPRLVQHLEACSLGCLISFLSLLWQMCQFFVFFKSSEHPLKRSYIKVIITPTFFPRWRLHLLWWIFFPLIPLFHILKLKGNRKKKYPKPLNEMNKDRQWVLFVNDLEKRNVSRTC